MGIYDMKVLLSSYTFRLSSLIPTVRQLSNLSQGPPAQSDRLQENVHLKDLIIQII